MSWMFVIPFASSIFLAILLLRELRRRHLDRWLVPYLVQASRHRGPRFGDTVHVILCIADHFEPGHGGASDSRARERVRRWVEDYPRSLSDLRDSDGRPPRHTFFYPLE